LSHLTISGYLETVGKDLDHESYQVDLPMNNKIKSIEVGALSPGGQVPAFMIVANFWQVSR